MDVPDYKIQPRDILYVSVKAQTPEGALTEMLTTVRRKHNIHCKRGVTYLLGYSIDPEGKVTVPLFGKVPVAGLTIYEIRDLLQDEGRLPLPSRLRRGASPELQVHSPW